MYEYNIRTSIPEVTWQFVSFKVENTDFKGRYNFKGGGGGKTKFYMYFGIIKQINLILI